MAQTKPKGKTAEPKRVKPTHHTTEGKSLDTLLYSLGAILKGFVSDPVWIRIIPGAPGVLRLWDRTSKYGLIDRVTKRKLGAVVIPGWVLAPDPKSAQIASLNEVDVAPLLVAS